MIKDCESVFYESLEELQATYKPKHPDVLRLEKLYGNDIQFSRIMHRRGVVPRFELVSYKVVMED